MVELVQTTCIFEESLVYEQGRKQITACSLSYIPFCLGHLPSLVTCITPCIVASKSVTCVLK